MTEQELRALVREVVAREMGGTSPAPARPMPDGRRGRPHASHVMFVLPAGSNDGACVIEPAVPCNHCGYCRSYGH